MTTRSALILALVPLCMSLFAPTAGAAAPLAATGASSSPVAFVAPGIESSPVRDLVSENPSGFVASSWGVGTGMRLGADRCQDLPPEQRPLCSLLGDFPAARRPLHGGLGSGAVDEMGVSALADDAGGLIGGNFPISNYPDDVSNTESLDKSNIAYNPNSGQYLVVWHAVASATNYDIFGRFVSAAGSPSGSVFAINQDPGLQLAPSVAFDASANQYWVTWSDFGSGSVGNVRLQRFSSTGSPLGSVITVNTPGPSASASRVACGSGRCIVVWTNAPGDGNSHILARSYDSSGNPATTVLLLTDAVGFAASADIAFGPATGNFLVAWEQVVGGWYDVMGIGVTKDIQVYPKLTISSASGHQRFPRVAYSAGAGLFLVVWHDGRSLQTWDIYGHLVTQSFLLSGSDLAIYAGTYNDYYPVVAGLDTTSQFAVAYETDTNGGGFFQIHACLVSGSGAVGSQFSVREWNNTRMNPAVAAHTAASDYLVTFTDNGQTTEPDILGQIVQSSAKLGGSLITVARGRKGQELPTVAYGSARDEFLTVWMDYRSGSDYQIYGRRVSATGSLAGTEIAIGNDPTVMLYGDPAVAYDSKADEYMVVWAAMPSQVIGYEIYARRLGGGGDLRGSLLVVSRDSQTGNEGNPRVAYNSVSDEYLVVWQAYTSNLWRIWGQRVSPTGSLLGSGFVISASTAACGRARLAYNRKNNEYLVIWQDSRNSRADVYGQRVSASGALVGGNLGLATGTGDKQGFFLAYGDSGNDYLLVWGDTRSGADVYGQHLDANGSFVGTDFPIANTAATEALPAAAYDVKNQGFLVTWQQPGATTDWDIYARRVPEAGTPTNAAFPVSTSTEIQCYVELAGETSTNEFLFVWQDFRAGSYDIYGQLWSQPAVSQPSSASLAIGTAVGAPGSSACVDLTLAYAGTANVASFTTDITYGASQLTPTGVTTSVSGKTAQGNVVSSGVYRVTVYGGTGVFNSGTVASVCFTLASSFQTGSTQLCHASGTPTASDVSGNPVTITGSCGSITGAGLRKAGDCNSDGAVSITELQQVINNQLGITSTGCGDCDGNGVVNITEVQKTVNCQLGLASCTATCSH